ncbi:MAG: hypothetical protein EXQ97_04285 [Alphaproteobacteria bacterium]|nr:hypothetical protein [Alphaproteobacteria bacterium]
MAALALAGCGMAGGTAPQTAAPDAASPAVEARQDAGAGARGADPQAAPRPQTPPDDSPARLVGLLAEAVTSKLGEPAMVRRDGHTQIWHYRAAPSGGAACVLHLFLYPDRNTARVTHVEARSGTDLLAGEGGRACLRAILAGRRTS